MAKNYKKNLLMCVSVISTLMFVSCVDYDKIVEEKQLEQLSGQETQEVNNIQSVLLGDINEDGKQEKLMLEPMTTGEVVLKLCSGSKVLERFKLEKDYDYMSLVANVINVDDDNKKEIVVLIKTSLRNVNVVKIINQLDDSKYELFDFPEEVVSNESFSGFNATVTAKEGFVYIIESGDFVQEIDASRIYSLSMKSDEECEKIEEAWNWMLESDFHGESLGVSDIHTSINEKGEPILEVYESIVGGDDGFIGYLVTEIKYDSNGKYAVNQIKFRERVDVMP